MEGEGSSGSNIKQPFKPHSSLPPQPPPPPQRLLPPAPPPRFASPTHVETLKTTKGRSFETEAKSIPHDFFVMITGRLESAKCHAAPNNLYCRYSFQHGPDWKITHGVSSGVTQLGRRHGVCGPCPSIVFNFPIDISFQSTTISGWPRIVVAVYGLDMFGRDVARGYVSILCPMTPGTHSLEAQMYVPISSSFCQRVLNWVNGTMPEFYDSKFVSQGEGRAATIVESTGNVKVILNVTTKQIADFGYDTGVIGSDPHWL